MKITSLKLTNIRSIETAEFRFQPGFNLVAGVNGVGKSTVLDALRFCLSRILTLTTQSRAKPLSFDKRDIRSGFSFLDADLSLTIGDDELRFTRCQWGEKFAADDEENLKELRREILESERLRDRARNLLRELEASHGVSDSDSFVPSKARFLIAARLAEVAPNCVFFSTNRSVTFPPHTSNKSRTAKSRTVGGKSAAYAQALIPRPIYVDQFADWMRAQEDLAKEQSAAKKHLQVLRSAVDIFLPTYKNLRPTDEKPSRLLIDQDGITLDVGQLSDGERGVLALVLDLARRLSQANPSLDDPLSEGHAVVLIDELDLHLHPKWQRQIVHNLTRTFPRCQFIATTHSPFVIQSLQHGKLINLDLKESGEYTDKSIEDIAENVMGIKMPQKSKRYHDMMDAAEEYFRLLQASGGDPAKLAAAEERLNELSMPFSDDPAFQALLKLERETLSGGGKDATG